MNIKRREFLKSVGWGAAAFSRWPHLSSCIQSKQKPNIVLIMADDVGYEGFSCYGSSTYSTPHIDELARTGIRFDHCYSTPLCTPSRVQMMTGKYNFRNYSEFGTLLQGEKTFAHLFKEAGYKTCVAGKWQLFGHFAGANYKGTGTHDNGTMRGISSLINSQTIIGAKGLTTDAGTHVPLVANWKDNIPEGLVCDDLIDFTDFLPTLLDMTGEISPSGVPLDGRSFLPQIRGEKGNPREWIFCHYDPKWGNWPKRRYIHNKEWKLYEDGRIFNLKPDILEEKPLNRKQINADVQKIITKFEEVLGQMK